MVIDRVPIGTNEYAKVNNSPTQHESMRHDATRREGTSTTHELRSGAADACKTERGDLVARQRRRLQVRDCSIDFIHEFGQQISPPSPSIECSMFK
jgi:hypothetical protein